MVVRKGLSWLTIFFVCLWMVGLRSAAVGDPIRGLVVDRTNKFLWIGLPGEVKKGAVFDIMLVPNSKVIARAVVAECTQDSPYVAKARFVMEDQSAFIPVGAYAELRYDSEIGDRDIIGGYQDIRLGSSNTPWNFEAGVFYPDERGLRKETSSLWPAFRLSYRLAEGKRSSAEIGLGYYHGEGSFGTEENEGSRRFRVMPLTLDLKVKKARVGCGGFYGRLGIGAYYIRDKISAGAEEEKSSVTTLGWQVGLGYESRKGRTVEVRYTDVSRSDFKGLSFILGARF